MLVQIPQKQKKDKHFHGMLLLKSLDRTVMTLIKLSLAVTASSMSFSLYVSLNGLSDFFLTPHWKNSHITAAQGSTRRRE